MSFMTYLHLVSTPTVYIPEYLIIILLFLHCKAFFCSTEYILRVFLLQAFSQEVKSVQHPPFGRPPYHCYNRSIYHPRCLLWVVQSVRPLVILSANLQSMFKMTRACREIDWWAGLLALCRACGAQI